MERPRGEDTTRTRDQGANAAADPDGEPAADRTTGRSSAPGAGSVSDGPSAKGGVQAAGSVADGVSRRGRIVRLVVAAAVTGLLIAGALVGQDDDFPFGPFRMYSTAAPKNAPVKSTRMEAVDASGRRFALTGASVGLRRAEIEGQLGRLRDHPALLATVATAYRNRNTDRPPLARIEIIIRHYDLRDGEPTGSYTDTVEVAWTPAGAGR